MTYTELRKALKAEGAHGGYLLYGDEDFLKRDALKEIRKAALKDCPPGLEDFNRSVFTLEDEDFSAPISAILSLPVMAEKRIVEIVPPSFGKMISGGKADPDDEEGGSAGLKKTVDMLSNIADAPETVLVVVSWGGAFDAGKPNRPSNALKQISKYLTPVDCAVPREADLNKWVVRHLQEEKLTAQPAVLDSILAHCPADMMSLANELDKLACFVHSHDKTEVTAEDVEAVASPLQEEEDFAWANAVAAGNRRGALEVLDIRRKRNSPSLPPAVTLAALNKTLSDLLLTSKMLDEGRSQAEIASALGLHPFVVSRYIGYARDLTTPKIAASLRRLREADRSQKTDSYSSFAGAHMDYVPLERYVCTIPLGSAYKRSKP